MSELIYTKNLVKKYKHITAVNEVSVQINKGQFYAIMGRSGSGKTTLLSLLGLLDTPTSGEIFIKGQNIMKLTSKELAHLRMMELGFVFQDFHLNPVLKAYENVMIPMYINPNYAKVDIQKKSMELLESFDLSDRSHHYPSELSGGQQQRVALARALANDPTCILADEPTGNLDTESEKIVFDYLKKLTALGKSVIVVSHNEIVLNYADVIYHMTDGYVKEGAGI